MYVCIATFIAVEIRRIGNKINIRWIPACQGARSDEATAGMSCSIGSNPDCAENVYLGSKVRVLLSSSTKKYNLYCTESCLTVCCAKYLFVCHVNQ